MTSGDWGFQHFHKDDFKSGCAQNCSHEPNQFGFIIDNQDAFFSVLNFATISQWL